VQRDGGEHSRFEPGCKPLDLECSSPAEAGVGGVSSDTFGTVPDGREFAARIYAAINAGDRGAIRTLSAPDLVVGTTVEAYRGREALLEWMAEGDDVFDDFTIELLEVEELEGQVVASMRQRGRGKASGAEVDDRLTHVWTLRDGRAIRLQSFARHEDAVRYAQRGRAR
jgi:ketosteroid isomerase-like protein